MRPRNRQTFLQIQYQIANSWLTTKLNTPYSNTSLVFLAFTQFSRSFRIGKYRLGFCKTATQLPEDSGCTAITTLKCPVTWSRTQTTTSTSTYLINPASISVGAVYTNARCSIFSREAKKRHQLVSEETYGPDNISEERIQNQQ